MAKKRSRGHPNSTRIIKDRISHYYCAVKNIKTRLNNFARRLENMAIDNILLAIFNNFLKFNSARRSSDNPPSQGCQSDNSKKTLVSIFADVAFRKCLVMEFFGRHQRKSRHIFKAFFGINSVAKIAQQLLTEKELKKRNVQ